MTQLDFYQPSGTFIQPLEVWWVHAGVRNAPQSQEEFLKDVQIFFWQFFSYRKVWYINLFLLCETIPMVASISLIDVILGIRKIFHGSGRVPERWPNLHLYIFELQRSVIYQIVCNMQDNSNYLVKTTYGRHPWNQEDPPWTKKSSWRMTKSTFFSFLATEKCDL